MTQSTKWHLAFTIACCAALASCAADDSSVKPKPAGHQIHYHMASKAEGQQELLSNDKYYSGMKQQDIEWRMRKTGATIDELKAYAQEQVLDFSEEQKTVISRSITDIEERLKSMKIRLPFPDDITYIHTTQLEEGGSAAYTHKTAIYLSERVLSLGLPLDAPKNHTQCLEVMAHELFHCLTRNDAEFRQTMYSLIGFTILDQELELKGENQEMMLTNPDVERIDNYAEFTINGEKRKCELIVLYSRKWADAAAATDDPSKLSFFRNFRQVLVPLDALDTNYDINDVPDFWDKVGRNTDYVFAPEECMADNFADAIVHGLTGKEYKTPQLIQNIISTLQQKYPL